MTHQRVKLVTEEESRQQALERWEQRVALEECSKKLELAQVAIDIDLTERAKHGLSYLLEDIQSTIDGLLTSP